MRIRGGANIQLQKSTVTIVSAAVILLCITSIVITLANFFVTLFFHQKTVFLKIKKNSEKNKNDKTTVITDGDDR